MSGIRWSIQAHAKITRSDAVRGHILRVHRVRGHLPSGDTASEQCSMLPEKYDAGAILRRNDKRAHVGFQVSQALQ
jgi:hypothetical protein